ncbi:Zn-ribbon domain-containing OB-fold protein [Nakamurella lactea]|uniref:Zn-ribbon domain-containing OB-fold protein n=1 Tax=Nakamurella lactea TaxID=459515 RepID=UPI0003FE981F|nr:OB-fold domain-containing protein [Nakamurella lactea]
MTNKPPERTSTVPRLVVTQDNQFWFDAAREGRLVIQRCTNCAELRHPPAPACAACHSFDWDAVDAGGDATLHSYTVVHHPPDPAFEYPLAIGLADLPEGIRILADIAGLSHDRLVIGMPLRITLVRHGNGEILPQLQPVEGHRS